MKNPQRMTIAKRYVEAHEQALRKACRILAETDVPCSKWDKTFPFCKFDEDEVCQYENDPALCWYDYLIGIDTYGQRP